MKKCRKPSGGPKCRKPSGATSVGFHEYDGKLEDRSRARVEERIAELKRFLSRLQDGRVQNYLRVLGLALTVLLLLLTWGCGK